jgi:hypothetical protein
VKVLEVPMKSLKVLEVLTKVLEVLTKVMEVPGSSWKFLEVLTKVLEVPMKSLKVLEVLTKVLEVPTKFLEVLVKFLTLRSSGEVSDHVPNLIVLCQDQQFFNKSLFTSPVIPSLGVRSNKVLTQVK